MEKKSAVSGQISSTTVPLGESGLIFGQVQRCNFFYDTPCTHLFFPSATMCVCVRLSEAMPFVLGTCGRLPTNQLTKQHYPFLSSSSEISGFVNNDASNPIPKPRAREWLIRPRSSRRTSKDCSSVRPERSLDTSSTRMPDAFPLPKGT